MLSATNQNGIMGAALVRAADAMLRSLGGEEVRLLLPAVVMPGDASSELGLVDPGVEEVSLSPVVLRALQTSSSGPRRRIELLIPSSGVAAELQARNMGSAQDLFESALGVVHGGELFHIEGMATEYFGGTPYLYRVVVVD